MNDLSEKEQIDQMRAWWSEYGKYVLGGIVVGIVLIVGIGQYRSNMRATQIEASVLYETLFAAVADGDADEAETAANDLYINYASTVYPSQARLAMARLYMDKGRDQDAADALRAIVNDDSDSALGLIASLRLAKVLLYQNKAQTVVDLLSDRRESAYAARYGEALGDAYVALGHYSDAREAYALAMNDDVTMPTVDRALVQMKLDDLPELAVADEATADAEDATADVSEGDAAAPPVDGAGESE